MPIISQSLLSLAHVKGFTFTDVCRRAPSHLIPRAGYALMMNNERMFINMIIFLVILF